MSAVLYQLTFTSPCKVYDGSPKRGGIPVLSYEFNGDGYICKGYNQAFNTSIYLVSEDRPDVRWKGRAYWNGKPLKPNV